MRKAQTLREKIARETLALSAGLTCSAIDILVLAAAVSGGLILCGPRGKDLYAEKKLKQALSLSEMIFRKYQQTRFRNSLAHAAAKGFFANIDLNRYELTSLGKKHFHDLLPSYKQPQKWDGRLWLITYDIDERRRRSRDAFRRQLSIIGCGMVQQSVWLSVKDPRQWLAPYVDQYRLHGRVIISCLGRDGSFGEEDIVNIVQRIFEIKKLSKRYETWARGMEKITTPELQFKALQYWAILKQDPILPKELLPEDWIGEKARIIFENDIMPRLQFIPKSLC